MKKRWKYNYPISEWTMKELEESIVSMKDFIDTHSFNFTHKFKDRYAELVVERTRRIGKKQ